MDNDYLKASVGPALSAALTSLAVIQPADSVDFLGSYLLTYVKTKEGEAARAEKRLNLAAVEARVAETNAAAAEEAANKVVLAEALAAADEALEEQMKSSGVVLEAVPDLLALLEKRTGATGVYLGRKQMSAAGASQIQYVSSTDGSSMTNSVLKGVAEGEEEGMEGCTWTLFTSEEVEEVVIDPETEEEVTNTKTVFPAMVSVDNVVRDKTVKHFGLPKLGSYLAVPVRYNSCIFDGGIVEAPPPAEVDAEAADEEKKDEGSEEKEGEAKAEAAAPAEPVAKYVQAFVPVEMVIGLDTIGQGKRFTPAQKELVISWATKASAAFVAVEKNMWNADVKTLESMVESEKEAEATVAANKEAFPNTIAEKIAAEGEISEDVKAFKEAELKQGLSADAAKLCEERLTAIASLNIEPKSETMKVLSAALLLVGADKTSFSNAASEKLDWVLMKVTLADLISKISAFDVSTITSEKVEEVKAAYDGVEDGAVPFSFIVPTSGTASAVLVWVKAACEHAEASIAAKQREAEAAAAAAEATEE
jgi:hypothetical protein